MGFREVSFNEASGLKTLLFTGTSQQLKNGLETPEDGAAATGALTQAGKHGGEKADFPFGINSLHCLFFCFVSTFTPDRCY